MLSVAGRSRREFLRLAGSLGLAVAAGGGCGVWRGLAGDGDDWEGPFHFIVMADPQFGMITRNESFDAETALFESAITHANRLRPRFVVVCGDMINLPGDAAQTAELLLGPAP